MATKTAKTAQTTTRAKQKTAKGDGYTCEVCGLAVTVDTACGCADVCDIICCGQPMQPTKSKSKPAAAQKKSKTAKA